MSDNTLFGMNYHIERGDKKLKGFKGIITSELHIQKMKKVSR